MEIAVCIANLLQKRNLTMSTAESCTGGKIASLITQNSGCSTYFTGGIVAYSNVIKTKILGVSQKDLMTHGAVSEQVVSQMLRGAQRATGSHCAVATSGIAGPSGGTPDKPVGTVWIGAVVGENINTKCYLFDGSRTEIINQSANAALQLLGEMLAN